MSTENKQPRPLSPICVIDQLSRVLEVFKVVQGRQPAKTADAMVFVTRSLAVANKACQHGWATEGQVEQVARFRADVEALL